MERKEIDKKYKWDLSVIYSTDEEFYRALSAAQKRIKAFSKFEKNMTDSAEALNNTMVEYYAIDNLIERLWQYASLNFSTDSTNPNNQELNTKVRNLAVEMGTVSWFVRPKILKLDRAKLDSFFRECPALESYRRQIEKIIRYQPHTLSDECEVLMAKVE